MKFEIIREPLSSVVDSLRKNDYFVKYFDLGERRFLVFQRGNIVGKIDHFPKDDNIYIEINAKDKMNLSPLVEEGKLEVKTLEGTPISLTYEGKADLGRVNKIIETII